MNKHLFKLVFSRHLGMYVPASEVASSKSNNGLGRRERMRRGLAAMMLTLPALSSALASAAQPAGLDPSHFTRAALDQARTNATMMTIQQSADKAVVDWNSLNLNRGETLNFDQQGNKSWQILNLIHSASPSTIAGNLNADGHVYLYNSNGIIFGDGAQINVGSLTATTLKIDTNLFVNGFLSGDRKSPVFAEDGLNYGFVNVEKGASINTTSGGRVMLLAPNVTNNGVIQTPDGQTILAAGHKIYMASSTDPSGLLVEVDANDGKAVNLGDIITQRGNATLVGYAVQQGGRITATSSVRANGSIILKARSNVSDANLAGTKTGGVVQENTTYDTTTAGKVTLDAGSITQVLPEISDTEEVRNAQAFSKPRIDIYGKSIDIDGSLIARGGDVNVFAKQSFIGLRGSDFTDSLTTNYNTALLDDSGVPRIYLGSDAFVNVAGLDASAPMSRNQLTIQLFSEQLKDSPALRGGSLLGTTIYVDARKGTNLTDIAPFVELQQSRTIAEKLSAGGTVNLMSTGDVVTRQGSKISVDGGSVTYASGSIKESKLIYDGKLYDVATAPNNLPYEGTTDSYSVTNAKWNVTRTWDFGSGSKGTFNAGYTDATNAGAVTINSKNAVLEGTVSAATKAASQQQRDRNVSDSNSAVLGKLPSGGAFNLVLGSVNQDDLSLHWLSKQNYLADNFTSGDEIPVDHQNTVELNSNIAKNGFNHLNIAIGDSSSEPNGSISIDSALTLTPQGSLSLSARNVSVHENINAPSTDITIYTGTPTIKPAISNSLVVDDNVHISSSGYWVNDTVGVAGANANPIALNAGNMKLTGNIVLGKNSLLDASAGAWLKENGVIVKGDAGNITLKTDPTHGSSQLSLNGSMQAYGFSKGGALTITSTTSDPALAQSIKIGGDNLNSTETLWFDGGFFQQGGFSSFNITGNKVTIGNSSGATFDLHPTMQTFVLNPGFGLTSGGINVADGVSTTAKLADEIRAPTSVTFSANSVALSDGTLLGGDLTLLPHANVQVDNGGSVTLNAQTNLWVFGNMTAHGGAVNLNVSGSNLYSDSAPYKAYSLWVDDGVTIDASGYYQHYIDNAGLIAGKVADAGVINISATNAALVLKEGSVLDVSGVSGDIDVKGAGGGNQRLRQTQYGNAGTIAITGHNKMMLDGDFKASALGTGSGGTLSVTQGGGFVKLPEGAGDAQSSYLNPKEHLLVTQHKVLSATGVNARPDSQLNDFSESLDPSDNQYIAKSSVSADQINQAGFDRVNLRSSVDQVSTGRLTLESGLNLQVKNSLTLDAPLFELQGAGVVRVAANYVKLANQVDFASTALSSNLPIDKGNSATLSVDAGWIDLAGRMSVTGAADVNLVASSDIRAVRYNNEVTPQVGYNSDKTNYAGGWLMTPGDLSLTARQVYPATGSAFRLEAQGADATLSIKSSGASPTGVLSAGGALYLSAANIDQAGVVKAPFGLLDFNATDSLTLENGSITSVAADGLTIPYGTTINSGLLWKSPLDNGATITSVPEKRINLTADRVVTSAGAKVSLAGGGNMIASEWIPGQGGSSDYLAQSGVYAVLPNLGADVAPYDPSYSVGSTLKVGDSVYLSGVSGLPAGNYTLLPARYALVPGAYVVNFNTSGKSVYQGQSVVQPDGSSLVSGYMTTNTSARDAAWSTYKVLPGSIFYTAKNETSHAPSEYKVSSANTYFADTTKTGGDAVRLPHDAGQLVFDAGSKLTLDADFDVGAVSGGRGAVVDITNNNAISVVASINPDDTSALQITADALNHLNAESILIGGVRSESKNTTSINTRTKKVTVTNDSQHPLDVPELILTASDKVDMHTGSAITAGVASKTAVTHALAVSGNGALLAISKNNDLTIARTGSSQQGAINIESGATVSAGRSVVFDTASDATLSGTVSIGDHGSLSLGAAKINIGDHKDDAGQLVTESGLTLDTNQLSKLTSLENLNLNSYSNVDVYDALTLGNAQQNININAAGVAGHLAANQTFNINAKQLTLSNSNAVDFIKPASANSNTALHITADSLSLAGNTIVQGFSNAVANTGELVLNGAGTINLNVANTTFNNGRVLAAAGSKYSVISSTGDITTTNTAAIIANQTTAGIAADLTFQAQHLNFGSHVEAPSGSVTLQSTAGDLNVTNGANVDVSTKIVQFNDKLSYSDAGQVTLKSDTNNVNVDTGATINVSGAGQANAGKVNVIAQKGTASITGQVLGSASTGQLSGSVNLDVNTLTAENLTTLNHQLNAGGLYESRIARVRTGDVTILGAGADAMKGREIEVTADGGSINVGSNTGIGEINASASKDSSIKLYAKNDLTLLGGSKLNAETTNADANGGNILLSATAGNVDLKTGAQVDIRGGSDAQDGILHLRALRTGSDESSGVKVTELNSTVLGDAEKGARIEVEAYKVYSNITSISDGTAATGKLLFSKVSTDNDSFMQGKASIVNDLGFGSDSRFHLLSGVEVQSTGDITLSKDWDLHSFRSGDEVGVLTLRAAGNVKLNSSLSDGFANATTTSTGNPATGSPTELSGDANSWSYRLVAGADAESANFMNTISAANANTGNLYLANGKLIRTGTGTIDIATGGNLTLGNAASVIYTVGVDAGLLSEFISPSSELTPLYLTNGGNINISAKGNIVGVATGTSQQIINQWLFRSGSAEKSIDTSWWVRPDLFQQGVATLGGGGIKINAGGDITNFSASTPTTAQFAKDDQGNLLSKVSGGGDLQVHADGNINSGIYYVARGVGDISAGNSITQSSNSSTSNTFGTVLAIQDAQINVTAKNSAYLEAVFNPTLYVTASKNASTGDFQNDTGAVSHFNSYSDVASTKVSSLVGNVTLGSPTTSGFIAGKVQGSLGTSNDKLQLANIYVYPATLNAVAYTGNVNVNGQVTLSPSSTGDLNLFAGQNVYVNATLTMSDAGANQLPTINSPSSVTTSSFNQQLVTQHASVPVHEADTKATYIVANEGDVKVGDLGSITSAKLAKIVSGRDVVNLNANIQQNNSSDLSIVQAGRNYDASSSQSTSGLTVTGSGNLLVTVDKNIDLGASLGVLSNANKGNAALPDSGASITMLAGLNANELDVATYVTKYINPQGVGPDVLSNVAYTSKLAGDKTTNQSDHTQQYLAAYREKTNTAVTTYMRKLTGNSNLSTTEAMMGFLALDKDHQSVLVYQHYLGELAASNLDQTKLSSYFSFPSDCNTSASCIEDRVNKLYMRGENAATALLGNKAYQGDLTLYNSTIKTVRDADITLLVPGGLVNAGLPVAGGTGQGVLTEKGGNIGAFVNGDFIVNQSKVITQYGGDITIWSEQGNIDAGKGSKTALSVPERTVSTDVNGVTTVEFKGVAAGSGIRAQSYDPDGPLGSQVSPSIGNVNLAPVRGQLIVGEAGLEGSNFVFGPNVSNAFNNIDVKAGGSISGGAATASGAAAPAPTIADTTKDMASQMQQAISDSAKNPIANKPLLPAYLNIEVIGLGD